MCSINLSGGGGGGGAFAAPRVLFTAVDTVSYTLFTTIVIYYNVCSIATCLDHCVWPFSSSSYKVIKEIQKRALPHILSVVHGVTGNRVYYV